MNFFKTSAFLLGFATLGIGCGDSSNNNTDVPVLGGSGGAGGSHADAYVAPGSGGAGAGGATVPIDSGAGGSTGVIDANASEANRVIDGAGDVTVDGGGGETGSPFDINKAIINATTTSVGLIVGGPAPILYTSCK
jgi:hypothetical protein